MISGSDGVKFFHGLLRNLRTFHSWTCMRLKCVTTYFEKNLKKFLLRQQNFLQPSRAENFLKFVALVALGLVHDCKGLLRKFKPKKVHQELCWVGKKKFLLLIGIAQPHAIKKKNVFIFIY
jgi:hypothetical protein